MKQHQKKIRRAKKMMTPQEISDGVGIFESRAWNERKNAKLTKQLSQYMRVLGQKGGNILKASKPADYYQKISALGNAKKAELKKLRDEQR